MARYVGEQGEWCAMHTVFVFFFGAQFLLDGSLLLDNADFFPLTRRDWWPDNSQQKITSRTHVHGPAVNVRFFPRVRRLCYSVKLLALTEHFRCSVNVRLPLRRPPGLVTAQENLYPVHGNEIVVFVLYAVWKNGHNSSHRRTNKSAGIIPVITVRGRSVTIDTFDAKVKTRRVTSRLVVTRFHSVAFKLKVIRIAHFPYTI